MGKYVMIMADKNKFILNEDEKVGVFDAVQNGESFVFLKGEMVSLQIIPTVITIERWWSQENERLAVSGKRLCKKCLGVMMIEDKCPCWEVQGRGEIKHGIETPLLPGTVKEAIQQVADKKSFPKLGNWEKGQVKAEEEAAKQLPSGEGWYTDPETGERMYT